jgi:hypothetical protein
VALTVLVGRVAVPRNGGCSETRPGFHVCHPLLWQNLDCPATRIRHWGRNSLDNNSGGLAGGTSVTWAVSFAGSKIYRTGKLGSEAAAGSFGFGLGAHAPGEVIVRKINPELWLLLFLVVIAAMLNFLVASQRMALVFYFLPTLFSAYYFGRRHATLTALASIILVVLLIYTNPGMLRGV